MKKALIVTHVSGFLPQFEMGNVRILQEMGYEVHYASNFKTPSYGTDNKRLVNTKIVQHQIDFVRSPFSIKKNVNAYVQLKKLMTDMKFDMIHCHTPMGGALTRLAAKETHTKPVLYTAHGFHFYKGAPLINWLVYYPAERYLSRYTDRIITINQEDYIRAQSFHAKQTQYIPGVGIDLKKIDQIKIDRLNKRKELGIPENATVILSVGELIRRKNYETALKAFAEAEIPNSVYLICGHGVLSDQLKKIAGELQIENKVYFVGYRNDVLEIMKCADIFLFPSFQEGLPVALMEAMACELPVIGSRIRGNTDLIQSEEGGYLYTPDRTSDFTKAMKVLASDIVKRTAMGEYNHRVIRDFSIDHVQEIMEQLYRNVDNKLME